jgi:hypothetical protein
VKGNPRMIAARESVEPYVVQATLAYDATKG